MWGSLTGVDGLTTTRHQSVTTRRPSSQATPSAGCIQLAANIIRADGSSRPSRSSSGTRVFLSRWRAAEHEHGRGDAGGETDQRRSDTEDSVDHVEGEESDERGETRHRYGECAGCG